MDWLDLLAVQGTLKSLLQHHSAEASMETEGADQRALKNDVDFVIAGCAP